MTVTESRPSVYVVDDDASVRESVASLVRSAGLRVETLASAQEFLVRSRTPPPSCLVLDVRMPGLSGLELQQQLASANVHVPIIFLTGCGDIPMSVRAIKSGALEFLTKPFDADELLSAIQQAVARDHRRSADERDRPAVLVGSSPPFSAALRRATLVARTDSTVLVLGETGTGKEMVARAIHDQSRRASRPFVAVNCGAIQPSLISSELFGHEKGAFTGATHQRLGRFEVAEGGTIFLDEIGDVPADTQVALLRVLQEREFERVGGNRSIRADVRVIAATHRDLKGAIAAGQFRSDLFFRLNVFPILLPPLRQRKEDIPLLVDHFLRRHAAAAGRPLRSLDEKAMEALEQYSWPGNIRELENVIERWAITGDSEDLSADTGSSCCAPIPDAQAGTAQGSAGPLSLLENVAALERTVIARTLAEVGGNQSEAARRLGLSRGALLGRLRKYGLLAG